MRRQGIIERFKRATPIIKELIDDLAWLQDEFDPSMATEEERTYAKQLTILG